MATFPVEMNDDEGQTDAINYLLSGPSGIGQNFDGINFSEPVYLSGSHTDPFVSPTIKSLQSLAISIDTGYFLDAITLKIEFTGAPLASIPFDNGDIVLVEGTTDANVNGIYSVGVIECTDSYVIIRDPTAVTPTPGTFSGGTILKTVTYYGYFLDFAPYWQPTDCNSFATVTGETDRVFIGGQIDYGFSYEVTVAGTYDITLLIAVNRYKGIPGKSTVNPKINFAFDGIVSDASFTFPNLTTTATTGLLLGPTFNSVIDNPGPGLYWYVLELYFLQSDGGTSGIYVTDVFANKRSLSTQVVKE